MTPIAKINVINQAMIELGRLPVSNANDSPDALLISAKLDLLFPVLLMAAPWNFAVVYRSDSTPLTTNFSPDYLYTYQLPSNYGHMFQFGMQTPGQPYQINDGLLQTNLNPVIYYYIVNNIDYDAIPALFYRALAIFAASDVCLVLTQNIQLTEYLKGKYEEAKSDAILENSMEQYDVAIQFNDYDRVALI